MSNFFSHPERNTALRGFERKIGQTISSARVAPYSGHSPEFAAAMERAEAAAQPKVEAPEFVGRTRSGQVLRADGSFFQPGPNFDRSVIDEQPIKE